MSQGHVVSIFHIKVVVSPLGDIVIQTDIQGVLADDRQHADSLWSSRDASGQLLMRDIVPNPVAAAWLMNYKASVPTRQALEWTIPPQLLQDCANGCPRHQHLAGAAAQLIEQQEY